MIAQKHATAFLLLVSVLLFSGCASLPTNKPIAPSVVVESVRPLNLSLSGQKLEFRLRIDNPNGFDLPVEGLKFAAKLGGDKIADGISNERVTVPANSDAILQVEVKAGLGKVLNRLRDMLKGDDVKLDYDVSGTVKLATWPTAIPFNVDGELENPTQ